MDSLARVVRVRDSVARADSAGRLRPDERIDADSMRRPPPRDTMAARVDSTGRAPPRLKGVLISASASTATVPSSAVVVTARELRATQASTPYDLLRQTAGIELHEQGQGPGFASNASIRGFTSDHSSDLGTWIDGVPNNEPVNGHAEGYNDLNAIIPQMIRSVEVIKGPTSALYGNFALAGALDIHTLERTSGTQLFLSGGSFGRADGTIITGIDRERGGGVLGVRYVHEGGWRPNSDYTLVQGQLRIVHQLGNNATIDLSGRVYGTDWRSPGFLTAGQLDSGFTGLVSNVTDGGTRRQGVGRLGLTVALTPNVTWRTTAWLVQQRWDLLLTTPPEGGGGEGSGSQTEEYDRRAEYGMSTSFAWVKGNAEFTFGGDARLTDAVYTRWATTNALPNAVLTDVTGRQVGGGAFAQLAWRLLDRLTLQLGARYDAVTTTSTDNGTGAATQNQHGLASPKAGLLITLPAGFALYGNVSRGIRQTDGVLLDPALPFITAWAYEGGIKLNTAQVSASVAAFRMDVSNEQTYDPVSLTSFSGGASTRQGIEGALRWRLASWLAASANGTLNDAKYKTLIAPGGVTLSGANVYNTADWVAAGVIELGRDDGWWQLRGGANAVGPYSPFGEPGVKEGAYIVFNGSAAVRVRGATFRLGVHNALNRVYPELRAGGFVAPGQARSVVGGVEVGF